MAEGGTPIPEGAVEIARVTIVSWSAEEGCSHFTYSIDGLLNNGELIGLLELVKHLVLQQNDEEAG